MWDNGDSMLIRTENKVNVLIDGGENTKILLPYLLDRNVKKLDYVLISHFDSDHYAGVMDIIGKIKIKNLLISPQVNKTAEFEEFLEKIQKQKIQIIVVKAGDILNISKNTKLEILWPDINLSKNMDLNDNSIVSKITYKDKTLLSTGDISTTVDNLLNSLYSKEELTTDILKIAHHGSNTSTSKKFLEIVKPKIALIGVGKDNKFGHPKQEIIERLKSVNANIYRTDLLGEITIKINKNGNIKVKTYLEENSV